MHLWPINPHHPLVTRKQAARLLSVSVMTIIRMQERGDLRRAPADRGGALPADRGRGADPEAEAVEARCPARSDDRPQAQAAEAQVAPANLCKPEFAQI